MISDNYKTTENIRILISYLNSMCMDYSRGALRGFRKRNKDTTSCQNNETILLNINEQYVLTNTSRIKVVYSLITIVLAGP